MISEPLSSQNTERSLQGAGSKDGSGAGDHDQPYRFGRRPTSRVPFPFTERQFAKLLILRSKLEAQAA
jgi:hypothetical protein